MSKKERNGFLVILGNLGWPLLMGAAASSVFYALIYRGPLNMPEMHRYFATHPVAFCATVMFFVGMSALLLKLIDVAGQYLALNQVELTDIPDEGNSLDDAHQLLDDVAELPAAARNSYLGRRLRDALQFVCRKNSADGLDEELKYLADMDAARQQDSYGLVRIITWATPMLGFLGTVIGITQALGDLDPEELATDIQSAMDGLLAGLYVAFDTTALALSLSIVLMFIQFLIDRVETQLLSTVDLRTNEQLVGRFQQIGAGNDPHLLSVERMSQNVLLATQNLVEQQTQLWQQTIDAAHQQWSQLVHSGGHKMQAALVGALEDSLATHADHLAKVERDSADRAEHRWEQWQTALSENARMMRDQREEMIRQGEVLAEVLRATGEVASLEKSLNQNLSSLAGAKNFEDTVMSLSAAIHLLNTRLVGPHSHIELQEKKEGRAA